MNAKKMRKRKCNVESNDRETAQLQKSTLQNGAMVKGKDGSPCT
jgi:hypothetical protein